MEPAKRKGEGPKNSSVSNNSVRPFVKSGAGSNWSAQNTKEKKAMANPFVHVELNTTDVSKAKAFYGNLFNW